MAKSPHLSDDEITALVQLLEAVRTALADISKNDGEKLHHARRCLWKRIEFDERGTPAQRKNLRLALMAKQRGICPICKDPDWHTSQIGRSEKTDSIRELNGDVHRRHLE